MLYLTTADKYDTYTVYRTLTGDTAPNGGLYLPFKMPKISMEEIGEKSFCECIAQILNQFFSAGLTGKEVEFCVGRYPVRIQSGHQKLLIAQIWRNLDGSYSKMERRLAARICNQAENDVKITSWLAIAIRIAVLFGVFSEILRQNGGKLDSLVDVAVPSGDFRLPMAVWYAQEMGLPVGNIVCACKHDSVVWDFLHLGELHTAAADPANKELERLICGMLGVSEVLRYREICAKGGVFTLTAEATKQLSRGIFCAVVSEDRLSSVVSNVYRTNSCILGPNTAAAYGGLMDYRGRSGESRTALLLADQNPADHKAFLATAMNMTPDALDELLHNA